MSWLLILAIVLPLAAQPVKTPKDKGASEANRAKSTANAKSAESDQTAPTQPVSVLAQAPVATESQRSAVTANDHTQTSRQQASDEDRSTQRKLTLFTGVLAAVGVLQLVVMFLTWRVYRRQAYEMRRQRHEMRRQRHVAFRQWKTMGEQAKLMQRQVSEMGSQTDILGKSIAHAEKSADSAKKSADALVNSERAWILVELREMMDGGQEFAFISEGYSAETGPSTRFYTVINLTNEGRSPCWITDMRLKFEIVGALSETPDLTSQPTEDGCVGTSLGAGRPPYHFGWMPTFRGRESAATMTVAYGIVKYRDIFGENRMTTFGFKVVMDSPIGRLERLTDYPEYNKST